MSDIKPAAWRTFDCARAITARELANVPDDKARRERCASLYPVPLYEREVVEQLQRELDTANGLWTFWNEKAQETAGKLAEARRQAFSEAAEIAENPFAHATKQFPDTDEIAADIASALRARAEETQGRSPAKLRLYWAYLGRIVNSTECAPSPEALHDVVKLHTGHVVPVMVKGFTVAVPKSISFASMSEAEFNDFLAAAEKWLIQTYGVSIADAFSEDA